MYFSLLIQVNLCIYLVYCFVFVCMPLVTFASVHLGIVVFIFSFTASVCGQ